MPLHLVSWNINQRDAAWRALASATDLDAALLQEARPAPESAVKEIVPDVAGPWTTDGNALCRWRTAIARFSDRVRLRPRKLIRLGEWEKDAIPVSRAGTLAVAEIEFANETITLVSAYAVWERPSDESGWKFADASVHRLISDISTLVSTENRHRVIVAGDFNILRGYGEHKNNYWKARYDSVFERMAAIGLPFVGPQWPQGRRAEPWPAELPRDSTNVPTFRSTKQTVETATRQLDFVFASKSLHDRLVVRAMNTPSEWKDSDHCQVRIELHGMPASPR